MPTACPNEPKPPRCALCEPESDVPEEEWLEDESLAIVAAARRLPPEPLLWLLDDEPRDVHSVLVCW